MTFSIENRLFYCPCVFNAPVDGFHLELGNCGRPQETSVTGLPGREKSWWYLYPFGYNTRVWRTHRRTDTGRWLLPRLRITSLGKNAAVAEKLSVVSGLHTEKHASLIFLKFANVALYTRPW